jgi:hypothetical protein
LFALQIEPLPQAPQSKLAPQPSGIVPHWAPKPAQVRGWQTGAPHTPGSPAPPQVAGSLQPPQSTTPPQPSLIGPQELAQSAVVFGVHSTFPVPHTSGTPAPPQVSVPLHTAEQFAI